MLGPVEASSGAAVAPLPGAHMRALVAALALAAGAPCSVEALSDDLWGDEPPQNARAALQTLVSRVRAAAGSALVRSVPGGYALGVTADEIDLGRARSLRDAASALAAGDPARLTLADEALALWRGQPGADLGSAPVAGELAAAAIAVREALTLQRARALLALGRAAEAADALAAIVESRPYDEPAALELMRALDAAGRAQDALAVFAALRRRLRDDLGASPSQAAVDANAQLLQSGATRASVRIRSGLRAEPNQLIGREGDVAAVRGLLSASRLVSVLGPGGLGKTRLAQAVAAAAAAPAVVFVPLASVRDGEDVEAAVAAALGITEAATPRRLADAPTLPDLRARMLAALSEQTTLLVLDNCEQVVDAVAVWTADALAAVQTLRVLATSRAPLSIAAEAVYPLAPLSSRTGDGAGEEPPAVRLFLERARVARPAAHLPEEVVARLCDRLDGLPLAIELAAARVRTMTPAQIEERLRDRFALLTTGDRAAPDRHRTLEAVIAWSWELLDPEARGALARLSVLPGGFTAEVAEGVLGTPVDDVLDRLVAQSLLVVADDPVTGGVRLRMLETVREFALLRLDEDGCTDQAWDAAFTWVRSLAEAHLVDALTPEVSRRLHAEQDNLVLLLRRADQSGRDADVVRCYALLAQAWIAHGLFTELIAFVPTAVAAALRLRDDDAPADALVLAFTFAVAGAAYAQERLSPRVPPRLRRLSADPRTTPLFRAMARLAGAADTPERIDAVIDELGASSDPAEALIGAQMRSQFAENDGDLDTALAASGRAWELARTHDLPWFAATSAANVAGLSSQTGRAADALAWLERAEPVQRAFAADGWTRQQVWVRGAAFVSLGRIDESRDLFTELIRVGDATADGRELSAIGWFGLAEAERTAGDPATAAVLYRRGLDSFTTTVLRASPWYLMALSGFVAASALDGSLSLDTLNAWAQRLRTRALANVRAHPDRVDKPVLGTVLTGMSAWVLTRPATRAQGLELLALAEVLGARQDLPSLHLADHRTHATRIAGAHSVQQARGAASDLAAELRAPRALELLTDQALRM